MQIFFLKYCLEIDEMKVVLYSEDLELLGDWQKKITLFQSQIILE